MAIDHLILMTHLKLPLITLNQAEACPARQGIGDPSALFHYPVLRVHINEVAIAIIIITMALMCNGRQNMSTLTTDYPKSQGIRTTSRMDIIVFILHIYHSQGGHTVLSITRLLFVLPDSSSNCCTLNSSMGTYKHRHRFKLK
jgi:hypothetical protein